MKGILIEVEDRNISCSYYRTVEEAKTQLQNRFNEVVKESGLDTDIYSENLEAAISQNGMSAWADGSFDYNWQIIEI